MKKMLIASSVLLLAVTGAYPQTTTRVYTSPKLPARDALERMNLVMAWSARVKVDSHRDGLFSVQIIPGSPNAQIVAQTYAGAVYLYDAENGDLVWQTRVGVPFWTPQPVGYNTQSIFAMRRTVLHVINRRTGVQRVYTVDPRTKRVHFGFELGFTPTAAPIADEDSLYVAMGDRVRTYDIPDFAVKGSARMSAEKLKADKYNPPPKDALISLTEDSLQPEFYWGYRLANSSTEVPVLVDGYQVSILTTRGTLISVSRFERGPRLDNFEFQAGGRVASAPAQHGAMAYLGCDDFNVYAVDMRRGHLIWRHVSGAPVRQKPECNDDAVYIAPERTGLRRLHRDTGREVWTNRDVSRFLASTQHIVYAMDRVGRFFVIDARRGTTLAKYDLTDWAIPVPNDMTDRIYLAADDGQILCLRNRDQANPLAMKTSDLPKKKEPMKDEKKEPKKKEEDKKDDKDKAGRLVEPRPLGAPVAYDSNRVSLQAALHEWNRMPRDDDRLTWAGR